MLKSNLIKALQEHILDDKRLEEEVCYELFSLDLFELGEFANKKREKLHQKKVYFNHNRHINPTNMCVDTCAFCAFSAHKYNPNPYRLTHEEIMDIVDNAVKKEIKEIHIVSAHNKQGGWQWYLEIFKKIKEKYPFLHLKALTAAEIHFLAKNYGFTYDEIIDKMIEYGVDSMPGGGAEIFDENIRNKLCASKVSSNDWINIHKLWHKRGRFSNATMLFGHIEEPKHRVDHMLRIRKAQDESLKNGKHCGFNAFIPLLWQQNNSFLTKHQELSSVEILKTIAVSRLILDNIPHIKAYWATLGLNLAMVAQEFGANDLDGTIEKESIQSAGGANSKNGKTLKDFIDNIKSSNYIPIERDSLYNEIKIYKYPKTSFGYR